MIRHLSLSTEIVEDTGLLPSSLRDLPQVVILAGPNGAGKTRILRLVHELVKFAQQGKLIDRITLEQGLDSLQKMKDEIITSTSSSTKLRNIITGPTKGIDSKINTARAHLCAIDAITFSQERSENKRIAIAEISASFIDYRYIARRLDVYDDLTQEEIGKKLEATKNLGLMGPLRGLYPYLAKIAQIICHSHNPMIPSADLEHSIQSAHRFNMILAELTGQKIGFSIDKSMRILPTLRNRCIQEEDLSEGEKVLIAWSIAIHEQHERLSSAILFIDEPELYLHPEACIEAIERLKTKVIGEFGQIWIATHSVPLLAHYGVDSIYFVKDGQIERSGSRRIEAVVDSLLGGPEGRSRLSTYLLDAEAVAFSHFAAQCVLPPGVVNHTKKDKQETQFNGFIKQHVMDGKKIRILDYAAGKGRFAAALHELANDLDKPVASLMTYYAFNNPIFWSADDRQDCERNVRYLAQDGEVTQYLGTSMIKLRDQEPFDIIVMANVLHEIPTMEWLEVIREVYSLLAPEGFLLIMEDLLPPIGELPHARGYIVLDEVGTAKLFSCKSGEIVVEKRDERLLAVAVPREFILRVSDETRYSALTYIRDLAKESIRRLRNLKSTERNHQSGRQHAHFTMLYTNAQLTLDGLI